MWHFAGRGLAPGGSVPESRIPPCWYGLRMQEEAESCSSAHFWDGSRACFSLSFLLNANLLLGQLPFTRSLWWEKIQAGCFWVGGQGTAPSLLHLLVCEVWVGAGVEPQASPAWKGPPWATKPNACPTQHHPWLKAVNSPLLSLPGSAGPDAPLQQALLQGFPVQDGVPGGLPQLQGCVPAVGILQKG